MPSYKLPNIKDGGSITVSGNSLAEAQQNAANQTGVSLAAQQGGGTFGTDTNSNMGGGGPSGPAQTAPAVDPYNQDILNAFKQSSGFSLQQLQEQKAEFDQNLAWQKQMWQQQGLPQLVIQQKAQALAEQEFQAQNALATASVTGVYNAPSQSSSGGAAGDGGFQPPTRDQAISQRSQELVGHGMSADQAAQTAAAEYDQGNLQTGNVAYGTKVSFTAPASTPGAPGSGTPGAGTPTEQAREFNATTGLDYLKTAASLGGPADYFQEDNFVRGAQQNGAPAFLSALRNGTSLGYGASSGNPTPQTAGGLINRMGGVLPGGNGAQYSPAGSGSAATPMHAAGMLQPGGQWITNPDGSTTYTGGVTPEVDHGGQPSQGGTPATGANPNAALGSINGVLSRGGGALSPQAMEQLNPDEQDLLSSGAKQLGYSMPAFLQSYQQSRIGQGAAQAA